MIDILDQVKEWSEKGDSFALASVVRTWGSSPRLVGSAMAVSTDMTFHGSVSGGCVEGAVIQEALQVLESGKPSHMTFAVSNDDAWSVGLTCGGKLEVLVEKFFDADDDTEFDLWSRLRKTLENDQPCCLVHNLKGERTNHRLVYPDGQSFGFWGDANLDAIALDVYRQRKSQIIEWKGEEVFVNVFPSRDKLILVGAAHISIELVRMAREFNFETTVIDPRGIFASPERFPVPPDHLSSQWPEEVFPDLTLDDNTYVVLLTHDPKIDDPAIHLLLNSEVAYIGALGSQKTQASRRSRLEKAGFSQEKINRIHGPVGIPIGAKTPQEIALSIMGEIIQAKYQSPKEAT